MTFRIVTQQIYSSQGQKNAAKYEPIHLLNTKHKIKNTNWTKTRLDSPSNNSSLSLMCQLTIGRPDSILITDACTNSDCFLKQTFTPSYMALGRDL